MAIRDLVAAIRQPEYTGQNRCLPCTVLNLGLVGLFAIGTGWAVRAVGYGLRWAVVAGGSVFAVAATAIYLRGYLIPGTPWLTDRYLPPWVHDALGKQVTAGSVAELDANRVQPLLNAGILTPTRDADDLGLTDAFRRALADRRGALDGGGSAQETFGRLLGVEPDELWLRSYGGNFKIFWQGKAVGEWDSQTAFRDDMAAASLLEDRIDEWQDTSRMERASILAGLGSLRDSCGHCEADVSIRMDSCCRSTDIVQLECEECGAEHLEIRIID